MYTNWDSNYDTLIFFQVSDHAGPQFQGPAFAAVPEQQQPPMPPTHQMQQQQQGQAQAMLQQSYPGDTGMMHTLTLLSAFSV